MHEYPYGTDNDLARLMPSVETIAALSPVQRLHYALELSAQFDSSRPWATYGWWLKHWAHISSVVPHDNCETFHRWYIVPVKRKDLPPCP